MGGQVLLDSLFGIFQIISSKDYFSMRGTLMGLNIFSLRSRLATNSRSSSFDGTLQNVFERILRRVVPLAI